MAADHTPGRLRRWLPPLALLALALAARAVAAAQVTLAPTQVSAYYVGVARNLVTGHGLVSEALWSYATPPLVLPQPAFSLWMPMASLLAAVPMALTGVTTLAAAQASAIAMGALLAPLTWLVAREAATANGLEGRRAATVALGSGLVAAIFGPFLLMAMGPESGTPFTLFVLGACLLMPRVIADADRADGRAAVRDGIGLGLLLGLAYLSRQEAIEVGVAYLLLALPAARWLAPGARRPWLARALAGPIAAGAVTVGPWFVRNLATFGSVSGQAIENLWFTRNEDVFAYLRPPTLAHFLAQGPATIAGHVAQAFGSQLGLDVLLSPFPIGALGLLAWLTLGRSPAFVRPTALRALLLSGALTFVVTGLLFPVATLWGTFRHASGPLLLGLIVAASLGLDAVVARVRRWRRWERANAWLAPLVLLTLAIPVASIEVGVTARTTAGIQGRLDAASSALRSAGVFADAPRLGDPPAHRAALVSDWSIWLAEDLGRPVIALPDEPPRDVLRLAHDFGTGYVLVMSGGEPGTGSGTDAPGVPNLERQPCFVRLPLPPAAGEGARLYRAAFGPGCDP